MRPFAGSSRTLLAAASIAACGAALASDHVLNDDDAGLDGVRTATPMPQGRRVGPNALAAPRYVRSEPALPTLSGIPAASGGQARAELSEISRRWWLSNDRADVGVGVGAVAYSVPASEQRGDGQALRNAVPALSLAMRYRVSSESALYADASNSPGLYGKGSEAYSAKVGVEWKPEPRTGWGFMQGGIGLRMDSGKTMTMRVKGGGLGVYLRSKF